MVSIVNRTIFTGDNLFIMRGMDDASVDLIYLDPPFNSNRHYAAPIGSEAAGAAFKDAWTFEDTDAEWWGQLADEYPGLYKVIDAAGEAGGEGDKAYLIYMAMRLLEMRRVLKDTGSIYLHCDPTMSHSLKLTMDTIFGRQSFRNEIVWRIGWVSGYKTQKVGWIRNHDIILYYVKNKSGYVFNKAYIPYPEDYKRRDGSLPTGKGIPIEDTWNCSRADILDSIMIKSFTKEKTGYPTQKNLDLLKRIIEASSNKGDFILDPFCGCATTCVSAELLDRQWIGIDISPLAMKLVQQRLGKELALDSQEHPTLGVLGKIIHRTDIPLRDAPKPTADIKHTLYGKQEGRCNGCKYHFPYRNLTKDHIQPTSLGGADTDGNLQLLCGYCNSVKGSRPMEYLLAHLKKEGGVRV